MSKISLKLRNLKLLHAKWVAEIYQYLKQQKKSIIKRFEKSRLLRNLKCANEIYMKCENSYGDIHSKKNRHASSCSSACLYQNIMFKFKRNYLLNRHNHTVNFCTRTNSFILMRKKILPFHWFLRLYAVSSKKIVRQIKLFVG